MSFDADFDLNKTFLISLFINLIFCSASQPQVFFLAKNFFLDRRGKLAQGLWLSLI